MIAENTTDEGKEWKEMEESTATQLQISFFFFNETKDLKENWLFYHFEATAPFTQKIPTLRKGRSFPKWHNKKNYLYQNQVETF